MAPSAHIEVLERAGDVEAVVAAWDRLAVADAKPYSAPGWVLAWRDHVAGADGRLLVAVAREAGEVVAVAPMWVESWSAGLLRASSPVDPISARVEPVGDPGALPALAGALAEAAPVARIDSEGLPAASPWPEAVAARGDRRAWAIRQASVAAPFVTLGQPSVDDWLGTRSSNFRSQMRRARRQAESAGAHFRLAETPEQVDADLSELERLHLARWDWRGGSDALPSGAPAMLRAAAGALGPERFVLLSLDLDGTVVGSQLFLAAGTELTYWNGGFDDAHGAFKPSLIGLVEAIRIGIERGCTRFDLGPGEQAYKDRFADGAEEIVWQTLIPRGSRYAAARALYGPAQARRALRERLSDEQVAALKRRLGRGDAATPPG